MRKEYGDYIEDIIDSMDKAENFVENMDYQGFMEDSKTIFAVVRTLEIIGEAVKNIPESLRKKYPNIPWRDMAGMRDKLIHEYSGVRLDLLWNTVEVKVPELKPKFQKILKDLEK